MSSYTAFMKALAAGVQPALQVQLNLTSNSLVKITVSSSAVQPMTIIQLYSIAIKMTGTAHLSLAQYSAKVQRLQITVQHSLLHCTARPSTVQRSTAHQIPAQHSTA